MIRKTLCALCATMALSTPSMGATVGFDIFFNGTDHGDIFVDDALLVPIFAPPVNHKVEMGQTTFSITVSGGTFTQASVASTDDKWVFDPTGTTLIGTSGSSSTADLQDLASNRLLTFYSGNPGLFRITNSTGTPLSQGTVAFARHPAAQVPLPASVLLLMSALLGAAAVPRILRRHNERRVTVAA